MSVDILSRVAVELPCGECGGKFHVSLGQLLDSHDAMKVTCEARGARECPGLYYGRLVDGDSARVFVDAWRKMAEEVEHQGGQLVLTPAPA